MRYLIKDIIWLVHRFRERRQDRAKARRIVAAVEARNARYYNGGYPPPPVIDRLAFQRVDENPR